MKFVLTRPAVQAGMELYTSKDEAKVSPLARKLFEIDGVDTVMMMQNFISVNKFPSKNWGDIVPRVMEALEGL